ncbi:hypothetical protein V0288_21765 [Pannus brasiliensis CCIBt3594]|uniref:Uncharacterized protein n=1 Tax=Pannus brasiliensis CCIBt3594 TaxID=1427578 RepID=A0AAW9QPS8_9CHRO
MDALPLCLNRYQLQLLNESIDRTRSNSPGADSHIACLQESLRSELNSWQDSPDTKKVISLPLDSYQLEGLRSGIFQEMEILENEREKQQLNQVLDQIPEYSLQENSD